MKDEPRTSQTTRVAVITITVPNDVGLALNLYEGVEAFVAHAVPDFSGVVSLRFEDEADGR